MGRLIMVEGLDLSGKSTLVAGLAAELGRQGVPVSVRRNVLVAGNGVAAEADRMRRDPGRDRLRTAQLFLAAHLYDAAHFSLDPSLVHVQDSWWLRTLAWERWNGHEQAAQALEAAALTFPRFDAVLVLTASPAERQRRYHLRGKNDAGDALVFTAPADFARLDGILCAEARRRGAAVLDTTGLTPAQVLLRASTLLLPDLYSPRSVPQTDSTMASVSAAGVPLERRNASSSSRPSWSFTQ
ncbi:MAG: hypothetical protein AB1758_22800 [Candidatus Eremiobacterota bacterium]